MKKKVSYFLVGLLVTCLLSIAKTKVYAQDFNKIEVNVVDEVLNASNGEQMVLEDIPVREEDNYGVDSFYYTFTLEEPAYVKIEDYADIFNFNFCGRFSVSLSTNKVFKNAQIKDEFANGIESTYNTILEAGTYYIKVDVEYKDKSSSQSSYKTNPTNALAIYAEPLEGRTKGAGESKKKAIKLATGETSVSQISEFSRAKYFSIEVNNTTDLIFQCNSVTKEGWDEKMSLKDNGILWSVYNEKGEKLDYCQTNTTITLNNQTKDNYVNFHMKSLKPGKYYVVAANEEKPQSGKFVFEAKCTPIILYAPKVSSIKRSGNNTAKIVLKGAVKKVSGYEIMYSTNKNMSGAKVVKLDKNTKLSRDIKGIKKDKTYYFQVRSYYKGADGNMYYGGYGKKVKLEK